MSGWATVFWIWIALDVGFVLGWMVQSMLEPRQNPTHTRQEHQHE